MTTQKQARVAMNMLAKAYRYRGRPVKRENRFVGWPRIRHLCVFVWGPWSQEKVAAAMTSLAKKIRTERLRYFYPIPLFSCLEQARVSDRRSGLILRLTVSYYITSD